MLFFLSSTAWAELSTVRTLKTYETGYFTSFVHQAGNNLFEDANGNFTPCHGWIITIMVFQIG